MQKKVEANGVERSTHQGAKQVRLLAGVLFDMNGEAMKPTPAMKKGVRYRYYVSRRLMTDKRNSESRARSAAKAEPSEPDNQQLIRQLVPARPQRAGHEMMFVVDGADNNRSDDPELLRLLVRAHGLARRIANNPASTLEDVSAQEGMGASYAARLMRLNYLAPEIVVAILDGRRPEGVADTMRPSPSAAYR